MSPARVRTRNAPSGLERTNYGVTAPRTEKASKENRKGKKTLRPASRFFDLPLIPQNGWFSPVSCWSNRFFTNAHDHSQEWLTIFAPTLRDNCGCFAFSIRLKSSKKPWNPSSKKLTSVTFQVSRNYKQDRCSVFLWQRYVLLSSDRSWQIADLPNLSVADCSQTLYLLTRKKKRGKGTGRASNLCEQLRDVLIRRSSEKMDESVQFLLENWFLTDVHDHVTQKNCWLSAPTLRDKGDC